LCHFLHWFQNCFYVYSQHQYSGHKTYPCSNAPETRPHVGVGGDWSPTPQARNLTCGGGTGPPDGHLIACRYRILVPPPKKKLLTPTYGLDQFKKVSLYTLMPSGKIACRTGHPSRNICIHRDRRESMWFIIYNNLHNLLFTIWRVLQVLQRQYSHFVGKKWHPRESCVCFRRIRAKIGSSENSQ